MEKAAQIAITTFLLLQLDPFLGPGRCWVFRGVDAGLSTYQDPRYVELPGVRGRLVAAEVRNNDFKAAAKVLGLKDATRCEL